MARNDVKGITIASETEEKPRALQTPWRRVTGAGRLAEKSSAAPRAAVPRALWSGATRHSRRCPSPGLGREQSTSFGLWTSRVIFF